MSTTAGSPVQPGTGPARTPVQASTGAFRIGNLKDPQRNRWLKALVYGSPGAGKTTLFGSAADVPEMCDVLYISAEAGEEALIDNDRIQNADGIDLVRVMNA